MAALAATRRGSFSVEDDGFLAVVPAADERVTRFAVAVPAVVADFLVVV